jgi:cytochrome c556
MRPTALAALAALLFCGCVPHRDLPPDQIDKLAKLSEVMDVQATVADPQFKKAGSIAYADADFAAFADVGARIQATSLKTLQFSKGPEFDGLAKQLHASAEALAAAAAKKDAAASSDALVQMKTTCKACHSKFK